MEGCLASWVCFQYNVLFLLLHEKPGEAELESLAWEYGRAAKEHQLLPNPQTIVPNRSIATLRKNIGLASFSR